MAQWPPGPSRRSGRRLVRAGAVLAVTLVLGRPGAASGQAAGDHPKWMYDAAQTGVNPAETVLGTGNVSRLRRAWSRDLLVGGGSPVVAGGRVYLGVTGDSWVYALAAATGATRWTADTGTPYPPKHLALAGGRLVVPTIGDPDGLLLALDPATGRVVWRSTAGTFGPPAVVGNRVYTADEGGALFAKDVTNGVNRWIGNGRVGSRTSPPSVGGGRVFTVNADGYVNAYAAAGCGALRCGTLWQARVPGDRMWRSTPAVGKTTIFIGGHNRLDALDAATGKRRCPRWTVEFNPDPFIDQVHFPPAVSRGAVYATGTVRLVARFSIP